MSMYHTARAHDDGEPCHHSHCQRCALPWCVVNGHSTMYSSHRGCFPLCEECWAILTPVDRLPYYRALYDSWVAMGCDDRNWSEIEAAVLRGL